MTRTDLDVGDELPYPFVLFAARYQGVYEGGRYVAFNERRDDVKLDGAAGNDITCSEFFRHYPRPYGRGDTPSEAAQDLLDRMRKEEGYEGSSP